MPRGAILGAYALRLGYASLRDHLRLGYASLRDHLRLGYASLRDHLVAERAERDEARALALPGNRPPQAGTVGFTAR